MYNVMYQISGWIKPELKPITASNRVGLSHFRTKSENISTKNSLYNREVHFSQMLLLLILRLGPMRCKWVQPHQRWCIGFVYRGQQKDYPLQSISFYPYGPKGLSFSCCATAWEPRLSLLLSQLRLNAVLQILTICTVRALAFSLDNDTDRKAKLLQCSVYLFNLHMQI